MGPHCTVHCAHTLVLRRQCAALWGGACEGLPERAGVALTGVPARVSACDCNMHRPADTIWESRVAEKGWGTPGGCSARFQAAPPCCCPFLVQVGQPPGCADWLVGSQTCWGNYAKHRWALGGRASPCTAGRPRQQGPEGRAQRWSPGAGRGGALWRWRFQCCSLSPVQAIPMTGPAALQPGFLYPPTGPSPHPLYPAGPPAHNPAGKGPACCPLSRLLPPLHWESPAPSLTPAPSLQLETSCSQGILQPAAGGGGTSHPACPNLHPSCFQLHPRRCHHSPPTQEPKEPALCLLPLH